MKVKFSVIFIAAAIIFSATACKKTETNSTQKKSSLSYKVNGIGVVCDVFGLGVVGGATDNTKISASVSSSAANSVSLAIEKDVVGVFALYSVFVIHNGKQYERGSGEFVTNVSTNNAEKIQGTFSGKCYELSAPSNFIEITDGKFEVFR